MTSLYGHISSADKSAVAMHLDNQQSRPAKPAHHQHQQPVSPAYGGGGIANSSTTTTNNNNNNNDDNSSTATRAPGKDPAPEKLGESNAKSSCQDNGSGRRTMTPPHGGSPVDEKEEQEDQLTSRCSGAQQNQRPRLNNLAPTKVSDDDEIETSPLLAETMMTCDYEMSCCQTNGNNQENGPNWRLGAPGDPGTQSIVAPSSCGTPDANSLAPAGGARSSRQLGAIVSLRRTSSSLRTPPIQNGAAGPVVDPADWAPMDFVADSSVIPVACYLTTQAPFLCSYEHPAPGAEPAPHQEAGRHEFEPTSGDFVPLSSDLDDLATFRSSRCAGRRESSLMCEALEQVTSLEAASEQPGAPEFESAASHYFTASEHSYQYHQSLDYHHYLSHQHPSCGYQADNIQHDVHSQANEWNLNRHQVRANSDDDQFASERIQHCAQTNDTQQVCEEGQFYMNNQYSHSNSYSSSSSNNNNNNEQQPSGHSATGGGYYSRPPSSTSSSYESNNADKQQVAPAAGWQETRGAGPRQVPATNDKSERPVRHQDQCAGSTRQVVNLQQADGAYGSVDAAGSNVIREPLAVQQHEAAYDDQFYVDHHQVAQGHSCLSSGMAKYDTGRHVIEYRPIVEAEPSVCQHVDLMCPSLGQDYYHAEAYATGQSQQYFHHPAPSDHYGATLIPLKAACCQPGLASAAAADSQQAIEDQEPQKTYHLLERTHNEAPNGTERTDPAPAVGEQQQYHRTSIICPATNRDHQQPLEGWQHIMYATQDHHHQHQAPGEPTIHSSVPVVSHHYDPSAELNWSLERAQELANGEWTESNDDESLASTAGQEAQQALATSGPVWAGRAGLQQGAKSRACAPETIERLRIFLKRRKMLRASSAAGTSMLVANGDANEHQPYSVRPAASSLLIGQQQRAARIALEPTSAGQAVQGKFVPEVCRDERTDAEPGRVLAASAKADSLCSVISSSSSSGSLEDHHQCASSADAQLSGACATRKGSEASESGSLSSSPLSSGDLAKATDNRRLRNGRTIIICHRDSREPLTDDDNGWQPDGHKMGVQTRASKRRPQLEGRYHRGATVGSSTTDCSTPTAMDYEPTS